MIGREADLSAHTTGRLRPGRDDRRDRARRALLRLVPDPAARGEILAALGLDGDGEAPGVCSCGCGKRLSTHDIACGLTTRQHCRRAARRAAS